MAGHSQFKNIMYRKGAQDAKRAKMFAKIAREIFVSVRGGLPDPNANPRLRAALASARAANMPKDNIDRAIKKALGGEDTAHYEEVRYEGYGPGGVALIVECLSDNRNRTAFEIRSTFSKMGGSLGETNSVSFMFTRRGLLQFPLMAASTDAMFEAALEAGAEDVTIDNQTHNILCDPDAFSVVRDALVNNFGDAETARLTWVPKTTTPISGDPAKSLIKLIDALEDNDDVQLVFSNEDLPDDFEG